MRPPPRPGDALLFPSCHTSGHWATNILCFGRTRVGRQHNTWRFPLPQVQSIVGCSLITVQSRGLQRPRFRTLPPLTLSPLKGKEEPWSPNRELRAPTGATGAPMGSYWAKCKALKKWRENKSRPSSFSLFRRAQPHGFLHRNTGLYQLGATSTHL